MTYTHVYVPPCSHWLHDEDDERCQWCGKTLPAPPDEDVPAYTFEVTDVSDSPAHA